MLFYRFLTVYLLFTLIGPVAGCASRVETHLRKVATDPLEKNSFRLTSQGNLAFSERTTLALRAYDIERTAKTEPVTALVDLQKQIGQNPNQDLLYSFAEIAYFEAQRLEHEKPKLALEIYFAALLHSYQYLFDPKFERSRNPYDSRFHDICLIYNQSLLRILRLLGNEFELVLRPDQTYAIQSLGGTCNIACTMLTADWEGKEIEKFKFAADYEIKGLQNEYKQSGLGVPLIAIHKHGGRSPAEKYYPPGLCFPVTAFLRPVVPPSPHHGSFGDEVPQLHAVLELYDSTAVTHVLVENVWVPLESDLTTPLAYFLSNPRLNNLSTVGLLRPDALLISRFLPKPGDELSKVDSPNPVTKNDGKDKEKLADRIHDKLVEYDLIDEPDEHSAIQQANFQVNPGEKIDMTLVNQLVKKTEIPVSSSDSLYGIYMMQPYHPDKIPVVMVHGLWSSPMTWMEMFNHLRSIPEIRDNYQFWFYFYPSAQPFWVSAAQLREDLAEVRRTLDPYRNTPALERMILVGHSMGGLVSRMQAIDSGDHLWQLVGNKPLEELHEVPEIREKLEKWFYFTPDPSVDRVITIATPFRGSDYSNSITQWFANRLIRLPKTLTSVIGDISLKNDSSLAKNSLLKMETSIESLSPKNPLFPVLIAGETLPEVQFNNIIGLEHKRGLAKYLERPGDGIVDYRSARIDGVQSEIKVSAAHSSVHTHPRSIMEVRRILLENLEETLP